MNLKSVPSKSGHAFSSVSAPKGSGFTLAKSKDAWSVLVRNLDHYVCYVCCALTDNCFSAVITIQLTCVSIINYEHEVEGLRNETEYWKLHWFGSPETNLFLSPPLYFPTCSPLLQEMIGYATSHMDAICSTGKLNNSFFWLWNVMQTKIHDHGFYGDVLKPQNTFGHLQDAPHTNKTRRKIIFMKNSAHDLADDALNAFGMEQA